jgi:putative serine protease PepD
VDAEPAVPEPEPGVGEPGGEDGPLLPWLPPEDRLWRHPSEAAAGRPPGSSGRRPVRTAAGGGGGRLWGVALAAGLIGAFAATGLGAATGWWARQTTVVRSVLPEASSVSLADTGGAGQVNWTAIDDAVAPSVVGVTVEGGSGPLSGSGLLLMSAGDGTAYVVTDRSLLSPALATGYLGGIEVTFLSGDQAKGKLVGQDPLSGLAVIEVRNLDRVAPPATGTVADLQDANPVLAIGSRSLSTGSVFPGSVSGEDRKVDLADGTDLDSLLALTIPSMASGAAGGPLVDEYGRVVGITVNVNPVDPADQQLAFAVPIDEVNRVVGEISTGRPVTHPWLGVFDAEDLPSAAAHRYGLTGGAQAVGVSSGSPAARAGLHPDDIITSLDGQAVTSTGSLIAVLEHLDPGQTVPISFVHDGRAVHTRVTLGEEPEDAGS